MKRLTAPRVKPSALFGAFAAVAFLWLLGLVIWAAAIAIAFAVSGVASAAPITPAPEVVIRADFNQDGVIDGVDLATLQSGWWDVSPWADLNGDALVNGADMAQLLAVFGWAHATNDVGDGATWAAPRELAPRVGPSPFGAAYRRLSWNTTYVIAPNWAPDETRIVINAVDESLIGGE